jgi:hypothetical protein
MVVSSSFPVHSSIFFQPPRPSAPNSSQSDIESSSAIDDIGLTIRDECSFRRMQSIEFFRDNDGGSLIVSRTRMRRLTAWRDVMDSSSRASSGYIDRATFLDVLDVQDSKLADPIVGYGTDHGYVDGKAFLIDAVMELDVTAEEKLRFIFARSTVTA